MNKTSDGMRFPPTESPPWLPQEVFKQEPERQDRFLGWWYRFTVPPHLPENASAIRRDADRRARLLSTVAFFFLATLIFFIPATLIMPISTFYLDLVIIALTSVALMANRAGKTFLAGIMIVSVYEVALAIGIVLITPMDATGLQLYDLFIIGELLAVSLLPVGYIFLVALLNSIFVGLDLVYHVHTPALAHDLVSQFLPALVRPIGLQFMVAGVVFLWVSSASKAILRANKAELIASLEHTVAEQNARSALEKQELEMSIQQLVNVYVDVSNNRGITRIPYPPAKVLWPLVGVINSLAVRLQHKRETEQQLQRLKQAIASYTQCVYQATITQQPVPLAHTGTELDTLILSLRRMPPAS